ncbi:MAG: hypothetical protein V1679_01985 [Candidatus Peregrinibacteria bacterium]
MKNSEKILHEKFVAYGADAKKWMRKCVLLLSEIDQLRIWEKKGFGSIYEYAAKLAGMSKNKVNEGLRVMDKVKDKPTLRAVVERKGVWAVKPVLTVATSENEGFWAEKADSMSVRSLETYVREHRRHVASVEKPLNTVEKEAVWMEIDTKDYEQLKRWKGDGGWAEVISELVNLKLEELRGRRPSAIKSRSRHVPVPIERYVLERCCGKCEFPKCDRDYSALHHADRFGLVREHNPDRIFALCREHHEIVHRGLVEGEDEDVRYWKIRERSNKTDLKYVIDSAVLSAKSKFLQSSRVAV